MGFDHNIEEINPQREATVGECEVSAVCYRVCGIDADGEIESLYLVDETCLFFPNGDSSVVGSYDDFGVVVATLRAANLAS